MVVTQKLWRFCLAELKQPEQFPQENFPDTCFIPSDQRLDVPMQVHISLAVFIPNGFVDIPHSGYPSHEQKIENQNNHTKINSFPEIFKPPNNQHCQEENLFPHFPKAAPQDSGPHHLLRNVVPKYTILHLWPNMTWEIGHPSIISTKSLCVQRVYWGLSKGVKNYTLGSVSGPRLPCLLPLPHHLPGLLRWTKVTKVKLSLHHKVQGIEKATTNVASESLLLVCRNMSKNVEAHPSVESSLPDSLNNPSDFTRNMSSPIQTKSNVIPQICTMGILGGFQSNFF